MGWGENKKKSKSKHFNKVVERDGIKFDSMLERYAYDTLKQMSIPFAIKKPITLQPPHVDWEGKTVKRVKILPDFTILHSQVLILFDPKQRATEEAKLKFKWLSYQLTQQKRMHVIRWADSNDKIRKFLNWVKETYFQDGEEGISERQVSEHLHNVPEPSEERGEPTGRDRDTE